ncbi:DUF302 domain-containing protein [Malonomonas rubra]|uniref:DUF302 domain-containing protein n=1 Tax=Malonomonas rubra TaxID=57040 RepID=UPI0026F310FD|nr:DUF302 domain-containing protein [Malonomonas rubra]
MAYYESRIVDLTFDQAVETVTAELIKEGFGILTMINVKEKMKEKLDVDFRNYKILGACNPTYALKALTAEPHIGTMLPCNVVVQELDNGAIEVAAVDPLASMKAVENPALIPIAELIGAKLKQVVSRL